MGNGQMVPAGRFDDEDMPREGEKRTEGFGTKAIERAPETAATAVAAQASAQIQARYIMAMQRPRDIDNVRIKLLASAKRPFFAQQAEYAKPIGKKMDKRTGQFVDDFAVGPSIRFVEEALRAMGNVMPETMVTYDDDHKRNIRVLVTDLEANTTYSNDVMIEKTVERSNAKGRTVLSSRTNSYGKQTYLVVATEDEMLTKQNALVSKALRVLGLRIVPGDLVEEAIAMCRTTNERQDQADPDAARKKIADGFAGLGVMPSDLKAYLGHDLAQCTPADLAKLRAIFAAVRDGETTWASVVGSKDEEGGGADTVSADLRERTKAKAEKARAAKPPAPAPRPADDGTLTPEQEARFAQDREPGADG